VKAASVISIVRIVGFVSTALKYPCSFLNLHAYFQELSRWHAIAQAFNSQKLS
jgi:hypothetical protein